MKEEIREEVIDPKEEARILAEMLTDKLRIENAEKLGIELTPTMRALR